MKSRMSWKYKAEREVQTIIVDIMKVYIIRNDGVITLYMQFVKCDKFYLYSCMEIKTSFFSLLLLSGVLLYNTALAECDFKCILYLFGLIH